MGPEKLFAVGIIFAGLDLVLTLPTSTEINYNDKYRRQCKSICAEAKGVSKFDVDSLTCFCEIPKSTSDVVTNLMMKKSQENDINLKVTKRNPKAKRKTNNSENINNKVDQLSSKMDDISKESSPSDFEKTLEQAAPNTVPRRQRLKVKGSTPSDSTDESNQRPPNISNKKTSVLSEITEEVEPNLLISGDEKQKTSTLAKRNPNLEIKLENSPISFEDKISPTTTDKKHSPSSFALEDVIGQASPNTAPQRQQQNTKGSSSTQSTDTSSNRRPPNISSQKTSVVSDVNEKESETLRLTATGKSKSPTLINKKVSEPAENFVRASSDLLDNLVGEGESISSSRQTTRRSTPGPRKPGLKRLTNNGDIIRRALESARQHIDTLIQRTNQPMFNPSTIGAEIEAICASLRSVSHRASESSRNSERSALMEQIRERERERHARIHSRFGGHEDRPRKLKPLLVGAANPKDKGAANKTEGSQGRKDEQKESMVITQPPELIDD